MQILPSAGIAAAATACLMAAALAQPPARRASCDPAHAGRTLTPCEDAVLLDPCPTAAASAVLIHDLLAHREYRRRLAQLPPDQRPKTPDDGGMGWAVPDADYWSRMPAEARAIPIDWSRLPALRFTNTQVDGEREVRLSVQGDYDLWLLLDPLHQLAACISVHRPTRRVWFIEIARGADGRWEPKRAKDPCYACHASGPRVVRPLAAERVDSQRLAQFNRRILSYGACDFGDAVNMATRGEPRGDARCGGCHDGIRRGKLYGVHDRLIKFKVDQEQTMPPYGATPK
jgi:hypothetical protein